VIFLRSDKDKTPQFCYNCWYYITVVVENPADTEYRVWLQRLPDKGTNMTELKVSGSNVFSLKKKGDQSFSKFILSSKDSF